MNKYVENEEPLVSPHDNTSTNVHIMKLTVSITQRKSVNFSKIFIRDSRIIRRQARNAINITNIFGSGSVILVILVAMSPITMAILPTINLSSPTLPIVINTVCQSCTIIYCMRMKPTQLKLFYETIKIIQQK